MLVKLIPCFAWLETRENTKTETVRRKMAELFKFASMEAHFEDMRSKWKNPEAVEWARKAYPDSLQQKGELR